MDKDSLRNYLDGIECDHTLSNTMIYVAHNAEQPMTKMQEIIDGGGFCDCEVVFNYCLD